MNERRLAAWLGVASNALSLVLVTIKFRADIRRHAKHEEHGRCDCFAYCYRCIAGESRADREDRGGIS